MDGSARRLRKLSLEKVSDGSTNDVGGSVRTRLDVFADDSGSSDLERLG